MKSLYLETFKTQTENIHPGLSVDCVIISFHEQKMKILLNKYKLSKLWMLPGGLVHKEEDVDEAVQRVLLQRTGLTNIKLRQFYLFGKKDRCNIDNNRDLLESYGVSPDDIPNLMSRYATLGYFAFVRYDQVSLSEDDTDLSMWFDIDKIPKLSHDHNEIINRAIKHIRLLIDVIPIGYELLPEEFTIVELRKIYEGILGEELDKRNFRKRMLTSELIVSLDKKRETDPYPQPNLYSFNMKRIEELLDL